MHGVKTVTTQNQVNIREMKKIKGKKQWHIESKWQNVNNDFFLWVITLNVKWVKLLQSNVNELILQRKGIDWQKQLEKTKVVQIDALYKKFSLELKIHTDWIWKKTFYANSTEKKMEWR